MSFSYKGGRCFCNCPCCPTAILKVQTEGFAPHPAAECPLGCEMLNGLWVFDMSLAEDIAPPSPIMCSRRLTLPRVDFCGPAGPDVRYFYPQFLVRRFCQEFEGTPRHLEIGFGFSSIVMGELFWRFYRKTDEPFDCDALTYEKYPLVLQPSDDFASNYHCNGNLNPTAALVP